MWPDRHILDLVGIEHPIIQAPMIGQISDLAIRVSQAGGLGSLACATLSPDQVRAEVEVIRQQTDKPFNLNFFCHAMGTPDDARDAEWRSRLAPYYAEFGLDPATPSKTPPRAPFDQAMFETILELRPPVVSFHFGLPDATMVERIADAGILILASATTVAEAVWLEAHGADAVIAQGAEAGGHRGMFLTDTVASQVGTFALVPQIADAVKVPVIAAGGVADARGIVAALALGAAAVQIGTAYLFCREAKLSAGHRAALASCADDGTVLTNVFTGRPARGVINRSVRELGPLAADAPAFPWAARAMQPLQGAAEPTGCFDFSPLWSGQAAALGRTPQGAHEMTQRLAAETLQRMSR